ncbi:CorA Metal Ion Transporter (MIT) Family [Achlya hypogyna]|uniref:Magnesium transporter n=1 Tax=Achlya hypogyna TaxID=1202772 RepID=A0A1V9ZM57_ACHHY|nr:CorA Metal Ion Transporter (MIT) Family [Achlya hypogyna]
MEAPGYLQVKTPSFRRINLKPSDPSDVILMPDMLASRHRHVFSGIDATVRNGKRLALLFHEDGSVTYEEVARSDVLVMVKAQVTLMNLQHSQSLHMRDMRKLDNTFSITNEPSLMVRKQAILINSDPLRSVIMRDRCYVFLPDGADGLVSMLKQHFKEPFFGDDPSALPFEFRAMEAIFSTMIKILANDCDKVIPVAQTSMDKISQSQVKSMELETLRTLKNVLNELSSQVNGLHRILMETLEDEHTLHFLYLSSMHAKPCFLADGSWSFDSEYVEALLESYLQEMYNQRTRIGLMLSNIENTESIVMMKLDATRNSLLTVDLSLTTFTTFVNMSTFVTGIFGMNLNSNLQTIDGIFYIALGCLAIFPVAAYVSFKMYFAKRGIALLG